MEERFSRLLFHVCGVGCLLGAVATIYFLFGFAGYVHSPLVNFTVAIALAAGAVFFLYHFLTIPRETHWIGWSIWAAILIVLVSETVLGFLPPISRDELTHHLAIPKLYVKAGRIVEVPIAPYAYYPMLLDMLYTPWVYWGYDFVPKWIHLLFAGLTGLSLYAYLARRMNAVYGLLGFLLFLSTPVILRLSHWGYIDLGITFYTTASLLCLLHWREERNALSWLALSALSLGFALATKPNGLVAALLIALLVALVIAKPPRKKPVEIIQEVVLFGSLTLIPFLPWVIKNWWQTGNPFFPLLGHLFTGRLSPTAGIVSFGGLGIFQKRELLFNENIWQIAALPIRIFLTGQDDRAQFFDGVLTPVLIVFLPWAFKGKWLEDKKLLINFALLFLLYAVFLVDMRIRYILSIVPPLVMLAVYGVFNIYLRIKRPIYLFVLLLAFVAWHGAYLWNYVQVAAPLNYLLGSESRQAYLARMLPEYAALRYINRETPAAAKIYLLFVGRRAYYCERDYFHDYGDLPGFLLGAVRGANSPDQIGRSLRQKNITHLLARDDLLARFLSNNLTDNEVLLWNEFATNGLKLAFREHGYSVYQFNA
jgi:hypothetical protein